MGAIVPIRTANGVFFQRVSGACSSGKIFEIEVLWDASLVYYKVRCTVITNCDSFFITRCDTAYYKLQQVLQSAMNLLQTAIIFTNCDSTRPRQLTSLINVQPLRALGKFPPKMSDQIIREFPAVAHDRPSDRPQLFVVGAQTRAMLPTRSPSLSFPFSGVQFSHRGNWTGRDSYVNQPNVTANCIQVF